MNFLIWFNILYILLINSVFCGYLKESKYLENALNYKLTKEIPTFKPTPIISIVTSVHNKEKYIKGLIRSLQNQDNENYEHILVDDYSTDKSRAILEEESERDPRIVYLKNEKNLGIITTLTKGVLTAKGKYLLIIDADDNFCNENGFNRLIELIEKNDADFVYFSSIYFNNQNYNRLSSFSFSSPVREGIIKQPELKHYIKKNKKGMFFWNKFYKLEIFKKAIDFVGKDFTDNYIAFIADKALTFAVTRVSEKAYCTKEVFLAYNWHSGSVSDKNKRNPRKAKDLLYTLNLLYKKSDNNTEDKLEFNEALTILNTYKIADLIKKTEYESLYIEFCQIYSNDKYLNSKGKNSLNSFCGKLSKGIFFPINPTNEDDNKKKENENDIKFENINKVLDVYKNENKVLKDQVDLLANEIKLLKEKLNDIQGLVIVNNKSKISEDINNNDPSNNKIINTKLDDLNNNVILINYILIFLFILIILIPFCFSYSNSLKKGNNNLHKGYSRIRNNDFSGALN